MRENGNPGLLWIEFKRVEIGKLGEVMAAEYDGNILIANRKFYVPEEEGWYISHLPKSHFCPVLLGHETDVYAVRVLPMETMTERESGREIVIFENVFVPKFLLKTRVEGRIAKILIRKPKGNIKTYLIFLKIEDKDLRRLIKNFFRKNLNKDQWRLKTDDDGLIEITAEGTKEFSEVKEQVLSPFFQCFYFTPIINRDKSLLLFIQIGK